MFHLLTWHKSITVLSLLMVGALSGFFGSQLNLQRDATLAQSAAGNISLPLEDDNDRATTAAAIAIVAGGVVAIAVGARQTQPSSRVSNSQARTARRSKTVSLDQTSQRFRRRLLRLLHDDRAAADRLLSHAQLKYPNQSADWYADKVIYDLERDRRSY